MALYTELGIEASDVAWHALGACVYTSGTVSTSGTFWSKPEFDALLLRAIAETGARDGRAVVWAIAERARAREASDAVGAQRDLAKAISQLAASIGAESAQALVARLPERMRPYAQTLLR